MDHIHETPDRDGIGGSENAPNVDSASVPETQVSDKPTPDGTSPEGRRLLLAGGYAPVLLRGKVPLSKDWSVGPITLERLAEWEVAHPASPNSGLRTGKLCVADIDLWIPEHAAAVSEAICAVLGETLLRRVGQKGLALLFHNPEPIRKITIMGHPPEAKPGDKPHKVEFLGIGQQLAGFGIHPATELPYDWAKASLGDTPLDTPLTELPEVSPALIREAVEAVRETLGGVGYTDLKVTGDVSSESRDEVHSASAGDPVTPETLEEMLSHIDPSDTQVDSTWISYMCAIKYAPLWDSEVNGPAENFDRFDLFNRWSSGALNPDHRPGNYEGGYDCEKHWKSKTETDTRADGSGLGSIILVARSGGYGGITRVPAVERLRGLSDINPAAANDSEIDAGDIPTETPPVDDPNQRIVQDVEQFLAMRPGRTFALLDESEQDALSDPEWLIESIIPKETLVLIFGPENSFKSFLAVDLSLSAAAGLPWAPFGGQNDKGGFAVQRPLTVVYVAGEGSVGIAKLRRPAWREARQIDPETKLPFFLLPDMPHFANTGDIAAVVQAIENLGTSPDIVVLDTVARAMLGLDENSTKDSGIFVGGCDYLKQRFGCAVIGIHHSGHSAKNRSRGNSNIEASFETRFKVTGDTKTKTAIVENLKQKDGAQISDRLHFQGEEVRAESMPRASLVFNRVPPSAKMDMSKDDKRVTKVRAALEAAGGLAGIVSTPILAAEMVHRELAENPAAGDKARLVDENRMAKNISRNLQRNAKDKSDGAPGLLRQFIVGEPTGGELSWTIPAETDD